MGRGPRITPMQIEHFWKMFAEGLSVARASNAAGFSIDTGKKLIAQRKEATGINPIDTRPLPTEVPDWAKKPEDWSAAAKAALADRTGHKFMKRYVGMELSPWQHYFWEQLEDGWEDPDRRYLCVNAPPGLGKSTVLVGFAAKRTVLNREIRGLFMSRAFSLAERNTSRLRRLFERTTPFVGAEATLSFDFGRFKARSGEMWRRSEFIVEQMDGAPIEEKEPTWAAFGFDAEWLGNRLDILIGDDLDSTRSIRNLDTVEVNRDVFDNELEPRLEAGGLMCVAQQRLGPFDFSNHVLSKRLLPEDDGVTEDPEGERQYEHVLFKAHYDELCKKEASHAHPAPAWPKGCLLDPRRLSYRDLRKAMRNPRTFQVVFQQNDLAAENALVQPIWVYGGRDTDGQLYPGCFDDDRDIWELPGTRYGQHALGPGTFGVITVDPSPTKWWAIQGWVPHQPSNQIFMVDQIRDKLEAPDFLDWAPSLGVFTGIVEDWRVKFAQMGVPLGWVIVEINAAQRFMLQYDHFQRWMRQTGVQIIAHSTGRNKSDEELGVQMVAPWWRDGRVRLPGKQGAKNPMNPPHRLVEEITRYPSSPTDDCVMAHWFVLHNLTKLYDPTPPAERGQQWRPSWIAA